MKTCRACGQEKPFDQFNWRNKAKSKRSPTCRNCMRLYIRKHYENNTAYYIAKARQRRKAYREATYKLLFEYLSLHPCVDCAETDPTVLEFDHIKQETKSSCISEMIRGQRPWRIILKEIAKCEVRCANCHRRRTARQRGYYLYLAEA
ncbi:MAG: hypothetical protein ACJ74J_09465 [Blastocatellia bacterium]